MNHRLGQLVFARQLVEGFARQQLVACTTGLNAGALQGHAQQKRIECRLVFEVLLFFAHLDFVKRWLSNVDVTSLDQLGHLSIEEGEQQGADVGAVHVGIGHDDDAVIAQFVDVEIVYAGLA